MPFQTRWIVEKRIALTQLSGSLSDEEARQMSETHSRFLQEGTPLVHLVIDASQLASIPINLKQNTAMGEYLRHPALGWTVLVGASNIVNFMVSVIGQIFHMKYARRETLEEAVQFLTTQDETITNTEKPIQPK